MNKEENKVYDLRFSLLMSVYYGTNAVELKECFDSIHIQSVKPDETVVVCDGPISDDVDELLQNESRNEVIKIVQLEENKGLGMALEAGLKECSYEIVARMDTDDICLSGRFEKQIEYINKHPDIDIVGGSMTEFVDDPNYPVALRKVPCDHKDIVEFLKKRCPFNHMTVMFKKSAVEKAGGYQHWLYNEDYYLWLRMYLSDAKFANLEDTLVCARVGSEMYRRRGGLKYYKSEKELQKFMLKNGIINRFTYFANVSKRFVLQVLMPNKLRGWVFKKFARKKVS